MAKQSVLVVLGIFVFLLVLNVEAFTSPAGHGYDPFSKLKMKEEKPGKRLTTTQSYVTHIHGTDDTTRILDQVRMARLDVLLLFDTTLVCVKLSQ